MVNDIGAWLTELGLGHYAAVFADNAIDGEVLPDLTDGDLEKLGLPLGHRKKILKALEGLRGALPSPIRPHPSPDSYTPRHLAEKILTSRSALEGERKQVTVLFCDIANSTELAQEAGAETMHGILSRFFELAMEEVHRYEGTVNQFLGDGFMALFGAPVAHEDDARRGVLAALGIRRTLAAPNALPGLPAGARLSVRMGLHTGPVVVGSIGDNLRMDYTAIGDTTNLAARLEQHAPPGQILVSEVTARLVKGYASVESLPALSVKGKAEPVQAYRVTSPGSRHSRLEQDRTLSPFVGRERELTALREALEEVLAGHGQVVGIVGEPGVGKSRVLYEFRRLLAERQVTYLEGWCQSFGQSIAYLPLQILLRAACGISDGDSAADAGEKLMSAIAAAGMKVVQAAPYLLRMLGIKEGTETLEQIGPEMIQARIRNHVVQLMLANGRGRPQVLAIEDLHWMDRSSEECLAALVENLAGSPVMLLTTTRPGYTAPWAGKSYATQIALRPLGTDAARTIVAATVERAALGTDQTDAILTKGEGNPLFLEELTLALIERSAADVAMALPDTIQGVLAARIDQLPEHSKRALQTASVLGREFPLRLLEAIASDKAQLPQELAALKQHEFVYDRPTAEGSLYTFKHVLTQQVAYDSLLNARRQTLHEAAGRALEQFYLERLEEQCELIAHHYMRSNNKEKALDFLELANRKAAKANAVADARGYFEEAMRVLDALPDSGEHRRRRIALLVGQVNVFILAGKVHDYDRHLVSCAAIAQSLNDDGLRGHFHACRGHSYFYMGRLAEATDPLADAAAICERAGNFEGAGQAYAHLAWTNLARGDLVDALQHEAPALHALARAPNLRYLVYAITACSWACSNLGRWDSAIEKALQALRHAESASDPSLVSFADWTLSIAYAQKGAVEEAIASSRHSFETAPTPADRAWAQIFYGWALSHSSPADGIELLAPLLPLWQSEESNWLRAVMEVALGDAYSRAGELIQAQRVLEGAIEVSEKLGMRFVRASGQRMLGEVMLASDWPGALERAGHYFFEAMSALDQCGAENELALAYAGCGRLKARLGNPTAASEYLTKALATFERLGTLQEPEKVRAELAALPR